VLNGIFHVPRTGSPWRDLPVGAYPYQRAADTVAPRFRHSGMTRQGRPPIN
jgi:transposase